MVHVVSSQIHFLARAGVGSGPPPAVHMSTVWLLERVYSFVSLVQMDISRSCGRVRGRYFTAPWPEYQRTQQGDLENRSV